MFMGECCELYVCYYDYYYGFFIYDDNELFGCFIMEIN